MSAAALAAVALAGCDTDGTAPSARSLQPLSAQMIKEIEQKNMAKESPILVRIFKEESELEVWKEDQNGRYVLLKTYPICRWSGELGPKIKEGDRQAPEGYYSISPSLMNPNSSYYLAINTGFPNAYDRANARTGAFLMIHGDCSSAGCYAMTDEQISEIYALARESFFGGQRAFQIQAYPFRMTPLNMARHRNSPHMPFWRMIKQGYDHFELTRLEPRVDVCDKRYVFDADSKFKFSAAAQCPAYQVKQELVAAVKEKQQREERETAELISRGTTAAPVRTGRDGGMHPTFLAAFQKDGASVIRARTSLPGTIPAHARPPGDGNAEPATASVEAKPDAARTPATRVANSQSSAGQPSSSGGVLGNVFSLASTSSTPAPAPNNKDQSNSESVLSRMGRLVGFGGSETAETTNSTSAPKAKAAPKQAAASKAKPDAKSEATPKSATARPPQPKHPSDQQGAESEKSAKDTSLMSGAQPTVPTGTFDNRWGQFR
jgi:murein L,D-transpeptidase YafK